MKRLIAGIVGIALIGVVIAGCSSSAASPRRARNPGAVSATSRLKRRLGAEISTLRAGQPSAPRTAVTRSRHALSVVPESGAPCFVAGRSRCAEDACPELVRAGPPAPVVVVPPASVVPRTVAPATCRRARRTLVPVLAP